MREIAKVRQDWTGVLDEEAVRRRQEVLRSHDQDYRHLLSNMLEKVRDERVRLINLYAHSLVDKLGIESSVGTTLNPARLLELALTEGEDLIHKRVRFEAVSFFDLARMLAWIERRPAESRFVVGEDMGNVIALLKEGLFQEKTKQIEVWTYHDPEDNYRVREIGIDHRLHHDSDLVREHPMVCRMLQDGRLVCFDHRPKGLFETALKMIKQQASSIRRWDQVRDRRGFKLIVPDVQQGKALIDDLQVLFRKAGGTFCRGHSNMTGNGKRMDKHNKQSSKFFRAAKCEVIWHDRVYEILVVTFQDYFSSQFALDGENHELYRLKQMLDVYFPLLWPADIYGIDWSDERRVRRPLMSQMKAKLGWRVKPRHKHR